ncbi:unnamed protein product [Caenorhabditis angaria]|uniref:phospholipase A2 n=1 Tax=Caenorhabditis angaria TaxID=860376 RepID=A0A9P1J2R1_9PELO|nr:unnamed protein product [Caenorhabditis angaria]
MIFFFFLHRKKIKSFQFLRSKRKMDESSSEKLPLVHNGKPVIVNNNLTETDELTITSQPLGFIDPRELENIGCSLKPDTSDGFINRSYSNPDMFVISKRQPVIEEQKIENEEKNEMPSSNEDFEIVENSPKSEESDSFLTDNLSADNSRRSIDQSTPKTARTTPTKRLTPRADSTISFENVVSLVRTFPAIINKLLKKPWYANRVDEVCTFPRDMLAHYVLVPTDVDNEKFLIVEWEHGENEQQRDEVYHLTYAPNGFHVNEEEQDEPRKAFCFSILRATDKRDLMDLLHLCDKKSYLFETLECTSSSAKGNIEELISQIRSKPHYQLIHIAIASDRIDFFSDESISRLNEKDEPFEKQLRCLCHTENCYPVHLAVAMNRVKIVERLLEIDPKLFVATDSLGNNVWHHVNSSACAQSIWDKCPETHQYIDERNNEGQSPLSEAVSSAKALVTAFLIGKGAKFGRGDRNELFLAMISKNAQSVVEVVLTDKPEIVHERDSLGNSPIHIACYKESLNALLNKKHELGLDVNLKNKAGETSLLVYMSSRKPDLLPLLVTLYSHGADLNASDPHGNTALHKAAALVDAKKISMDCVKFLIAAGSDPNKLNDRGESPRHVAACIQNNDMLNVLKAAGASRCIRGYRGCRNDCRYQAFDNVLTEHEDFLATITIGVEEDYEKTELNPCEKLNIQRVLESPKKGKKARINLISLDGGGIRGLVIIQTLIAIEKVLKEDIFKYFDWSAGTSTGSLIMAGLARGKTLRQMQQTYLMLKDRVFDGYIPPYDTLQLEKFIQDEFGLEAVSDIKYPRLMISAVNSEKMPVRLEMARNYKPTDVTANETPKDMPLWMALRRSTAAPVLFKPSEDRYIDGGIISNNPALDLLGEVHGYNRSLQLAGKRSENVEINCIVSLGTGQIPCTPIDTLSIDSNSPLQSIKTIKNLASMFIDQATASEGAPVARCRQWADSLETPFFRFSAPLSKNIFLSSTSDLEICTMMWDTYIYCQKHQEYIEHLVEVLRHDADHPLQNNPFLEL